ncbi:molybdenum cofactor cytidylyltransferase [Muriicola jejuensis]|uniref:NTP transferase domain-containing protein n=1 Tax=Muriicola jejuensis TaxID=504488 RepID=A0A6P0UJN8_9FLAO|nr:nucleotidyltransferase family protein [Muriicola jejuensis]NER11283.1 NTP transferase domain-containing protein [Muriicola jejuensis]SMP21782.1 molybdenum cofactor cytidylyltransferase [Muriicola jejuensis]
MKITILLLAAGASRRMGRPKQLLPWGNSTLLGHAIETAISCQSDQVFVVLGAGADTICESLEIDGFEVIINEEWAEGIGATIRRGISHVSSLHPVPDAVLIMLADQPLIGKEHLENLMALFKKEEKRIVCTEYVGKLGVPAVFPRRFFPDLARLTGDHGGGKLIAAHAEEALGIPAVDKVADLDTPQDYLSLTKTHQKPDS